MFHEILKCLTGLTSIKSKAAGLTLCAVASRVDTRSAKGPTMASAIIFVSTVFGSWSLRGPYCNAPAFNLEVAGGFKESIIQNKCNILRLPLGIETVPPQHKHLDLTCKAGSFPLHCPEDRRDLTNKSLLLVLWTGFCPCSWPS